MIHKTALLECAVDRAFVLFTERASEWWPESRRHTRDPRSVIRMLPEGRFWEEAATGEQVDLGRVRLWEPPVRVVLDFYVGTDVAHPTEVTVTFTPEGSRTRVKVDHGPLPASTDLYERRAPAYEKSWDALLSALERSAQQPNLRP